MPASTTSYLDSRCVTPATIANGTATTGEIDLGGTNFLGISFPATMTQTTFKLQYATVSGGTYQTVTDSSGADIVYTFTQNKTMFLTAIQQEQLVGIRFMKILAGGNEGADRVLQVISRQIS